MANKKELNEKDLENVTGGHGVIPIGDRSGKTYRCTSCGQIRPGSDIGIFKCFSCGGTDFEEVEQ